MQLAWRPVSIGDGPPISTSLTANEAAELRRLARDAQVLEVGSAYGYSTIVMAQVAEHVTAIDWHVPLNSLEPMRHNLEHHQVQERVTILVGLSQDVLPTLVSGHASRSRSRALRPGP